MIFALLLLSSAVVLRDDTNIIEPQHWRYDRFVTKDQLPVDVDCTFRSDGPQVRVELMTEDNLQAMRRGVDHDFIAASKSGRLHQEIGMAGMFAIVVINDDKVRPATVNLRLALDFAKPLAYPRTLSPQRKFTVITLSFVGFLLIVTLSARSLVGAMRKARSAASESATSTETPLPYNHSEQPPAEE
jgi:hypothetical protein